MQVGNQLFLQKDPFEGAIGGRAAKEGQVLNLDIHPPTRPKVLIIT